MKDDYMFLEILKECDSEGMQQWLLEPIEHPANTQGQHTKRWMNEKKIGETPVHIACNNDYLV